MANPIYLLQLSLNSQLILVVETVVIEGGLLAQVRQNLARPCLAAPDNPPAPVPHPDSYNMASQSGLVQNPWPVLWTHAKLVNPVNSVNSSDSSA
ncbi:hypothetical protein HER10_EVM0002058 [Colletotrichum scovillei]|uniref:uncharacterized protein n=1 Tax=Colletotrichum scovillei TaxID=1209932 RepID=UPI0015C2F2D4|nr:uncharacterized protein HER10_EVM0002058 [Colletotrichum scovillei]KAF4782707.1 hypothetical protein HER10_EVM0002058 [Colletotrichum scovillei]